MIRTLFLSLILCGTAAGQGQVLWVPADEAQNCPTCPTRPQYQFQQPQRQQPQRTPPVGSPGTPQFDPDDEGLIPVQSGENPCEELQSDIDTLKADNQALLVRIEKLELQIVNLATMPGQRGEKGDRGEQGLTGEAGQSPTIDINALANAVSQNLNYQELAGGVQPHLDPFYIRAYRDDPYQPVHLGQKVDLNLEKQ